ncbi:hypothetical protein BKA57DRAFT_466498 [Linnemannia elongata]|nr:hypothetical protein BKA57DRAFT_466498 [Linnemannia elongata]
MFRYAPLLSMRLATTTAMPFLPAAISETYPQSKRTALLPARSKSDRTLAHLILVHVPQLATCVVATCPLAVLTNPSPFTPVLQSKPCPSRSLLARTTISVSRHQKVQLVRLQPVSARTMRHIVDRPFSKSVD